MSRVTMTAALAQIAPVFLDRERTLAKVVARCQEAADRGCDLVAFGEALVPGYPAWLCRTDAARFDAPDQKQLHARYLEEAVQIEAGHLEAVCAVARARGLAMVLGILERPADRGGHSVYCSRVFVQADGQIGSVHRKLVPTYEERLAWAPGDGHGLVVHPVAGFQVGALNCWENWMPLARTALYAAGENVHLALWPGSAENTGDITRFIAREGRCYALSVCGLLRAADIPDDVPQRSRLLAGGDVLLAGGSAAAAPDGTWLVEPQVGEERLYLVELSLARVFEERQNFDPVGHYARPDVLQLQVHRARQSTLAPDDGPA